MSRNLIHLLNEKISLKPEAIDLIKKYIPSRNIKKDEFLLKDGEVSTAFFFVTKGCIRLYYPTATTEKTAFFYTEGMFVSSYESFVKQTPSKHCLQAIEHTDIDVITFETAHKLLETFPEFESLARIMMEEELIVYQDIISRFITMSPEERYASLQENEPKLLQRIPQYHLATYLGVAPETLSRIRKRLAK